MGLSICEAFEGAENYFLGHGEEDITDSEEEGEDDEFIDVLDVLEVGGRLTWRATTRRR